MPRGAQIPLFLAAVCVAAFAVLLGLAYGVPLARWADAAALQGFVGLQGVLLTPVFERLVHLADPQPYALLGLALIAVALARRRPRSALAAAVLLGGSAVSSQLLKPLLAAPRHQDVLGFAQINDAAYPSGHATASMALALAAVLVVPAARRPLVAALGAVFVAAMSFSILGLGWHFPSDVVGGFLVASAWCLVAVAGLRAAAARWPERSGRDLARRALEAGPSLAPRHARVLVGSLGIGGAVVFAALLPRIAPYAERHTTFAAVAVAVVGVAMVLIATVTAAATRRL